MMESARVPRPPEVEDVAHEDTRAADRISRILIADDDPSVVRLLADHCARLGFDVDTASNGIQVLLKASRVKPDIIIVDVNLPEVDGLSVCAHALEPDKRPVNMIVITGSRNAETLERCEGFGAYYVRKGPEFWNDLEAALVEIAPCMFGAGKSIAPAESPAVRRRPFVLLVDDDGDVIRFLSSRLEKSGLEVKYASDALQAFRMACRDKPAVIVTDYFMPDGDAQYLLTRLRTNETTENIPVIVQSGQQLSDMIVRNLQRQICGHAGAAQILRKSQDLHVLFGAMQRFCGFEQEFLLGQ